MKRSLMIGMISGGITLLTSVMAGATPTVSELRLQGLNLRAQGRYADAIATFQQALIQDPASVSGYVLLGWTYHKAKQDHDAAETLTQAIVRDPWHIPAWNALGIVYLVQNDLSGTLATHGWAAWLEPENEIAYYNLSLALEGLQEYTWARWAGYRAAALEPDNPHPWVAIAIAEWGAGAHQQATQSYRNARVLDARYQDPEFLGYLDEAGFSTVQIQTAQQLAARSF